jgi:cell division protein FtsB
MGGRPRPQAWSYPSRLGTDGGLGRIDQHSGGCVRALGLGTGLIIAVAASALLGEETGIAIWRELRESLVVSNARVAVLERQNEALRREIETLEVEPAALDRAIREELDLALPGETIVYFTDPESTETQ